MFSRAALSSRSVIATAAVLGTGAAVYHTSRSTPIRHDSAMTTPVVRAQMQPEVKTVRKKTFTGMRSSKELKVAKNEELSHDMNRITFHLPSEEEVSGLAPSDVVLASHTPAGSWIPVIRPYTPIHNLDEPGVFQLLVKRYPNGASSTYIHSLQPGSSLWFRGPKPGYAWKPSTIPRDILMIAGGAGITPVYSLAKGILSNADDKTRIRLLWSVHSTKDIVLDEELTKLERQYPGRIEVSYAITKPDMEIDGPLLRDGKKYRQGYVTTGLLEDAVKQCQNGSFGDEKGMQVFLCGPPAMEEAVSGKKGFFGFGSNTGALGKLGVESGKVHRF